MPKKVVSRIRHLAREVIANIRRHPIIFLPFIWYYLTAARTITHGDAALNVDAIAGPIISTHVNNHNVSILMGWFLSHLLPFGSIAFRDTFQAIFFGGLTVALFYFLVYRLFGSRLTSGVAALILTVSNSLWWHSTVIESATGNACFMVLALWLIVLYRESHQERYVLWLIFLSGLGIFQHAQLGVLALAAAVLSFDYFLRLARGKSIRKVFLFLAHAAGVSLAALLPFSLTLIFRDAPIAGSIASAFHSASGGTFQQFMFQGSTWYGLKEELYLIWLQFPSPFLLLLPVGFLIFLKKWGRSWTTLAPMLMCFVNAWFFIYFNTWDRFEFMLISFVVLAFWATFALDKIVRFLEHKRSLILNIIAGIAVIFSVCFPPYLYAHLPIWGQDPHSFWSARYNNYYTPNTHDIASLIANPDKHNYWDVDNYAHLLFEKLPLGSTYIDDDSRTYYQVEYFRKYYHERPDVGTNMLNSWNLPGWGLDNKGFEMVLEGAYQTNGNLFLVSLAHPFAEVLSLTKRHYRFETFYLGSNKWVYRLVTAKSDTNPDNSISLFEPSQPSLDVGLGFDSGLGTVKTSFLPTDHTMARFSFAANPEPFLVSFRWSDPSGQIHELSTPFFVQPGNTSVWSYLEGPSDRPSGNWRVEALVNNQKTVASQIFRIN